MGVVSAPVSNSVIGGPSPSAEWPCADIGNSLHLSLFCVCVCLTLLIMNRIFIPTRLSLYILIQPSILYWSPRSKCHSIVR